MTDSPSPSVGDGARLINYSPYDGVLWRRAAAYLLDLFFAGLICLPLAVFFFIGGFLTFTLLWAPLPFLWVGVNVCYYVLMVGGLKGATWGQSIMGLAAVSATGEKPGHLRALVQIALFYLTVCATYSLVLLFGLFNAQGRLVHDYFSELVIRKTN